MSDAPDTTRRALVRGNGISVDLVATYLPLNYRTVGTVEGAVLIEGEDVAGWTLDGYVLPRLASGLMFGTEVTP